MGKPTPHRHPPAPPLTLTDAQVRQRLQPHALLSALRAAFLAPDGTYITPQRHNLQHDARGALVMPCQSPAHTGVKVSTWFQQPGRAPAVHAAYYTLYSLTTGLPVLTCQATALTELRTAAVSALATGALASPAASTLGLFGTGPLALAHLRFLPLVRPIARVLVCGSTLAKSGAFARAHTTPGLPVVAAPADRTAAEADILCTCTTSATPVFDGNDLRPGTHINAVGAFHRTHRELDSATVARALVVADHESALTQAGEIVIPLAEGRITSAHLRTDLQQLLRHGPPAPAPGTTPELTLFKSLGLALEDLAAAELLLRTHPAHPQAS